MDYLFVLLLRIVSYLEGAQKIVLFIIVFFLMSYSTLKRVSLKELKTIKKYNFYALLLITIIFIHGIIFGHVLLRDVAVLITYWIWLVFTYNFFKNKSIEHCLRYILISFFIFNFVNFLYFKISFADQKFGINSILSLFGVFGYRIYFPLSSGANIYTSQLALNSIIVLYFLKNTRYKLLYTSIYLFYFYMLIIADSRLILVFSITFSFVYWFSFKTILEFIKKFWWILGVLFFVFLFLFYSTDIFNFMKRGGELSGKAVSRIEIWTMTKDLIISDFHIFSGYGLNGLENNMPDNFKTDFEDQNLQTSHNFLIQNFIDFGIIGITIVLYLLFEILKIVHSLKSQIISILFIMILFMGITESIPSFYSFEPTLFFISILSIILTSNERKSHNIF